MMEVGHIIWEDSPEYASDVIIQGTIIYHGDHRREFTTFGSYHHTEDGPVIKPSLEDYGVTINADYLNASGITINRIGKIV